MPDLSRLEEIRICVDDDEAGLTFATEIVRRLAVPDSGFKGGVALAYASDHADEGDGCKDVCDLWTRYGRTVVDSLASGKTRPAKEILDELSKLRAETPQDYKYSIPADYSVSEKGVVKREENTKGEVSEKTVLSYPLLWGGLTRDETGLSTELLAPSQESGGATVSRSSVAKAAELVNATHPRAAGDNRGQLRDVMRYLAVRKLRTSRPARGTRLGTRWLNKSHYAPFVCPSTPLPTRRSSHAPTPRKER